jgi:hypothetical protein
MIEKWRRHSAMPTYNGGHGPPLQQAIKKAPDCSGAFV